MPWITAVLGAFLSRTFGWVFGLVAYLLSKRIAVATAFVIASAALFATMAAAVKVVVLSVRVVMPASLSGFTYFLPPSINLFIGAIVTVRMSYFLWRWTQSNLSAYAGVGASRTF